MTRVKLNPMECGARCESCPLSVSGKPKPDYVVGEVPENAVGVLVSDGPTPEDASCQRILAGNTGRELDTSLQQAVLHRDSLAVVPAFACKPGINDGPDARLKAAQCCKPFVLHQLGSLTTAPKLLMGAPAASQFTKIVKGGVGFMRGFIREEIKAIITWSPGYAFFKDPYQWAVFDGDVRRYARYLGGVCEPGPEHIDTSPTAEGLRRLVDQSRGVIAVDIETWPVNSEQPWTGKDPTKAILRSIQFGNLTHAISFLWSDATHELQQETKRVLEDPEIVKVWCNGFHFDLRVLRRYGMNSVNNEDIRDLRCALSATAELSLRNMASQYCDLPPFKELGMDDTEK